MGSTSVADIGKQLGVQHDARTVTRRNMKSRRRHEAKDTRGFENDIKKRLDRWAQIRTKKGEGA